MSLVSVYLVSKNIGIKLYHLERGI